MKTDKISLQTKIHYIFFKLRNLSAEERAEQRKEKNKIRMRENRRSNASPSAKDVIVSKNETPKK